MYNFGYTQSHTYTHYTKEDGLPSSEVYSAFQDSKGYMWFATDAGVSRFNGYEFENFGGSNGLTDNTVFLITEDAKGRIWFGTFNCRLSYYENDSIYPYKFNKVLEDKLEGKHIITSINVDEDDRVLLGLDLKGIYEIDKSGHLSRFLENNVAPGQFQTIIIDDKINFGFLEHDSLANTNMSFLFKSKSELKNVSYFRPLSYRSAMTSPSVVHSGIIIYFQDYYGSIYAYNKKSNMLQKLKLPDILYKIKRYTLFYDNELLYICTSEYGVYQCSRKGNSLILENQFLKGESIGRMFKDNQGGYWFSSLDNGVFYCPSFSITNNFLNKYVNESNPSNQILIDQSDNFFFNIQGKGFFRKDLKSSEIEVLETGDHAGFSSCYYDKRMNRTVFVVGNKFYAFEKESGKTFLGEGPYTRTVISDSNQIYYFNDYGVGLFVDSTSELNSFEGNKGLRFRTCAIQFKEKLWIGTNKKIELYPKNQVSPSFLNNKYLSSGISSIARFNDEILLIGTKSYGLVVANNERIISIINVVKGLVDNSIKAIHVDDEKTIWIGTNKGISKLIYQNPEEFNVINLTKKNGLLSEEILSICSNKNQLFISAKKGISFFDKNEINVNTDPLPVYITRFNVNLEDRSIQKNQDLTYKESFIRIDFEGLNYRSLGKVEYEYRMLGVDTNWVSTILRSVQYPTLQPNDYTFEVRAKNEDDIWSKPTTVSFTINPPFWLTWWFITLEIILGLLIIYTVFKYREKQLLLKGDIEKKMVELELKALRSQMNPHFIFNTLNSIQFYIATSDFRSTNKYIAQFSRLIRAVLNLSEKNVITIEEEVEMLELYMDLEKMRFEEQFDYQIVIGKDIDVGYDEIPSMLIQPYVENSIWHGLMNSNKKGEIKVAIEVIGDYICCSIQDNGIGRKKAAEIKAKRQIKRKSVGMSITQERLDIINNEEVKVEVLDLEDAKGIASGTKTIIKIPYKG